jgi:hypothetical protein
MLHTYTMEYPNIKNYEVMSFAAKWKDWRTSC